MMPAGTPGWCLLVGLCTLTPTQGGPGDEDPPPDPHPCGITFHTPSPCSPPGAPQSSAVPHELEHLKELLVATKASLEQLELAAALEGNQSRYQDIITEALPSIHGDNLEFQESLENVRRELEAHVARAHHPLVAQRKEKLQEGVRVVAHMLRLTGHLAQDLDEVSQRIQAELGRQLGSSAEPGEP